MVSLRSEIRSSSLLEGVVDVVQPRDLAGLDRQVVADVLVELAFVEPLNSSSIGRQ